MTVHEYIVYNLGGPSVQEFRVDQGFDCVENTFAMHHANPYIEFQLLLISFLSCI